MVRRIGLKDVARVAQVTPATVSLALSGTGTISKKTTERVRLIADEMGYRRNRVAANLRRQRTSSLGVLIPTLNNPFYSEILASLERAAIERGYSLVYGSTNHDTAIESRYVEHFLGQHCDGIIVVTGTGDIGDVERAGVPTVLVNSHVPAERAKVPRVEVDDTLGAYSAAAHLIRLGHRHIGLVVYPYDQPRRQGYLRALADAGIDPDPALTVELTTMNQLMHEACERTHQFLLDHPDVSAIVAMADIAAVGVLRAAALAGRRVPDDLAVVGFDDIELASMLAPALTTVAQPIDTIADAALNLVVEQIDAGAMAQDRRRVVLETRLIVRESCGGRAATSSSGGDA